jgi:hypothetical protein
MLRRGKRTKVSEAKRTKDERNREKSGRRRHEDVLVDTGSYEGLLLRAIIPGRIRCMSGKTSSL